MYKRYLKKSEVLREGYMKGLRKAQRVIKEMLAQSQGFDNDFDEFDTNSASGIDPAVKAGNAKSREDMGERLLKACEERYWSTAKKLILLRADVNAREENNGYTPLHYAAHAGKTELCKLLLNNGADVNEEDRHAVSPLIMAASQGYIETCKLLLDNGARINDPDNNGQTPLHFAAENGYVETCKLLLKYSANVNAKDTWGDTPLRRAETSDETNTVKLLRQYGAK